MSKADLCFVADALLSLCARDRRAPFHSNRVLAGKIERDRQSLPTQAVVMCREGAELLFQSECEAIVRSAGLTPNQYRVLRMRVEGSTFEEIGESGCCTKQAAQRVFVLALKKLTLAYHVYQYAGLSEVYRAETHRGLRGAFGTMHR